MNKDATSADVHTPAALAGRRRRLRDLLVKELSLVDRPANEGAKVLLRKIDHSGMEFVPELLASLKSIFSDPEATKREKRFALRETFAQYAEHTGRDGLADIAAIGKGTSADRLMRLYYEEGPAFAEAWDKLSDEEKEQFRVALDRQSGDPTTKGLAVVDSKQLIGIAKRITDGADTTTTRHDLIDAARKIAIAERQDGETVEKALGRFWASPAGQEIYRASKLAPVAEPEPEASAGPQLGPAMRALHKRADEIRVGTKMSRQQAVAKIAVDPAEQHIWRAAREERI